MLIESSMLARIHKTIVYLFSSRRPSTVLFLSLLLLILLGSLDYITGDYSLIVFYLVPVSLVSWFTGRRNGFFFCFLALITRVLANDAAVFFDFSGSTLHYWNEFVEFLFLLIMSFLFSALSHNLNKERTLASTDPLTGAINRRSFFGLAEYELHRCRRYQQPFTLAYTDLDNFKVINDRWGHQTGDELLQTVVSTITANIRSTDILSRFGGDEFVLLLPETGLEAAHPFLEKLHAHLQQAMDSRGWPVSFSIGAITYRNAPDTIDEVLHRADSFMYDVKHSGKNRMLLREADEVTNGQRKF